MNNSVLTYVLEQKALEEYNLEKALKYVKEDIVFRNSGAELTKIITDRGADISRLKKQFGEMNFSNWLRGKNISREKAIELCFALDLNIFDAEVFLQRTCGHDWFHLRNYKDIVFYFCLSNKLAFDKALELIDKYSYLDSANPSQAQSISKNSPTFLFKQEVEDYETEDELHAFFMENEGVFGSFNNTAYRYFKQLFDKVQENETRFHINEKKRRQEEGEFEKYDRDDVSFDTICEMMRIGIPYGLRRNELTSLQLALYEDAPNRSTLVDVYNKKADNKGKIKQITRKPLIIIWMMANEEKEFIPRVNIINGILEECGMPKLDAKNPFDWIVLNALESDGIVRMEEIIQDIFPTAADETGLGMADVFQATAIYVVEQGVKITKFPITKNTFVIGRSRTEVDCCFDDPAVDRIIGRKHANISRRDGQYYLTHTSTAQGVYTYVNNETKLSYDEIVLLNNGDVIRIGRRELMFEVT